MPRDYWTNPAGRRARITPKSKLNAFLGDEPEATDSKEPEVTTTVYRILDAFRNELEVVEDEAVARRVATNVGGTYESVEVTR
jgi:hypothetical protein